MDQEGWITKKKININTEDGDGCVCYKFDEEQIG